MLDRTELVKREMDEVLGQLCKVSWMFSVQPGKDFSRNRKLSFPKIVSFLLAMEGGTLTTELLKHFGCSPDTASASALVQQRKKLAREAFATMMQAHPFLLYPVWLFHAAFFLVVHKHGLFVAKMQPVGWVCSMIGSNRDSVR